MTIQNVHRSVPKPAFTVVKDEGTLDERLRQALAAHETIRRERATIATDGDELRYVHDGLGHLDKEMSSFDGFSANVLFAFRNLSSQFYVPGTEGEQFAAALAPRVHAASRYLSVLTAQAMRYFELEPDRALHKYGLTMQRARGSLADLSRAACGYKDRLTMDVRTRIAFAPSRMFPERRVILARTIPWSTAANLATYHEGFRLVHEMTSPAAIAEGRSFYRELRDAS